MGYAFFRDRALSGASFTLDELIEASGWSKESINAYRSKQWKDLLEADDGSFRVRREFLRLSEHEFLDHITQKRPLFAKYKRTAHPALLIFEFLLPLTRTIFFLLFAEAIVRTIKGEDEIWLLERGVRDRLYRCRSYQFFKLRTQPRF